MKARAEESIRVRQWMKPGEDQTLDDLIGYCQRNDIQIVEIDRTQNLLLVTDVSSKIH